MNDYRSWGMKPVFRQKALSPGWVSNCVSVCELMEEEKSKLLAFGNGRSYGDSCFNSGGLLIDTKYLNRIRAFDRERGVLTTEPGVTIADILQLTLPLGWCVPVTPGTSFVTVGGAVANDVHGKNHHAQGSFGNHLLSLTLLKSDGSEIRCSDQQNRDLFRATIGGLGLTGFISEIELQLQPVNSDALDCTNISFKGIDQFMALSAEYGETSQYCVAWLDCLSSGRNEARGIFTVANHCEDHKIVGSSKKVKLSVPFNLPSFTLNRFSISTFNAVYFHMNARTAKQREQISLHSLFFPLDAVGRWNRIYGANGLYQFQFVVPMSRTDVMSEILKNIRHSGLGSFLAVIKIFGTVSSLGMMSFPRPGICLALDFAFRDPETILLLKHLESLVIDAGGAIYPAKDRLMSVESFAASFPGVAEFEKFVDPGFCSDYWRRVRPTCS